MLTIAGIVMSTASTGGRFAAIGVCALFAIDPSMFTYSFLLAALCGAAAHICGVHLYAWLKKTNGGHAHFPFEKVVIPVLLDILVCWVFWGTELCACKEIIVL